MDKKICIIRVVSIILLIATAVAIFAFSSEPARLSKRTSGGFVRSLCSLFYPGFDDMNGIERAEIIYSFQRPIRKAAHVSIFGVLAFFAFLSAITYKGIPLYIRLAISYAFCTLYAASDEIHQYFVPGRAGRVTDVLVDLIGITVTTTFMLYVFKKTKLKRFAFSEE